MCKPKLSSEALIVSNGWHILLSGNAIHNNSFSFGQAQAPKQYGTYFFIKFTIVRKILSIQTIQIDVV